MKSKLEGTVNYLQFVDWVSPMQQNKIKNDIAKQNEDP